MTGRPSKRTPEREARILQVLEAGNTRRAAAAYVGIDPDTFSNWMRRYSDFSDRVCKAEASAEVQAVAIIRKGIQSGDTNDAKWWLERRRPEDYGRRDKIELRIDIEERVRGMARTLGLDEDEVLGEAQRILDSGHAPAR